MPDAAFTIGRLAAATGAKIPTIRYYEQIGLMPAPERSVGNQRRYGDQHLKRLSFIRHGRELGFTLEAIRDLLNMADRPALSCAEVDSIAHRHLAAVERRIESLAALKAELQRMLDHAAGGTVGSCRVIEVLSDHALCAVDRH